MQHCSLLPGGDFAECPPDRHGCCKPCCGYILEEIHSHRKECCCFHGILNVCGLPQHLMAPLTLCSVDVVCISPQCIQDRSTFRLTLRCSVIDCRGRRACGETCITVALRHVPECSGENLRLCARLAVKEARFCAPSAFEVCADIRILVVTSSAGRILKQPGCAPECVFPPLYPAPIRDHREKRRIISERRS